MNVLEIKISTMTYYMYINIYAVLTTTAMGERSYTLYTKHTSIYTYKHLLIINSRQVNQEI